METSNRTWERWTSTSGSPSLCSTSCCEPWHPEAVPRRSLPLPFACALACACGEAPEVDPLDRELIRELALERGTGSGDAHSGTWEFEFEVDACDCPSVDVQGQTYDLCELVPFVSTEVQVTHSGGRLAVAIGEVTATGPIESDGSFVVASLHDASTVLGPLESLARIDGRFDAASTHVEGWAGQRLIGELVGEPIDCRRTGTVTAQRP